MVSQKVPIEVNGILFWGIDKGEVTIEEVNKISSPPDSVLHLLRHFISLLDEWMRRAVQDGIASWTVMEEEIRMPGSKWNPETNLQTPEDAIRFSQDLAGKLIKDGKELRWIGRGQLDFCYFSHLVTPEEKKQMLGCGPTVMMGTSGLISVKEVPDGVKVVRVFNRGGVVNVVEMDLPATNKVAITLARKENGVIQVYSAFPGVLTPPIPRASQDPEEQEYNRTFWDQHALVRQNTKGGMD